MREYRVTFFGSAFSGIRTKSFDSEPEAIKWIELNKSLNVLSVKNIIAYDSITDEYRTVGHPDTGCANSISIKLKDREFADGKKLNITLNGRNIKRRVLNSSDGLYFTANGSRFYEKEF